MQYHQCDEFQNNSNKAISYTQKYIANNKRNISKKIEEENERRKNLCIVALIKTKEEKKTHTHIE